MYLLPSASTAAVHFFTCLGNTCLNRLQLVENAVAERLSKSTRKVLLKTNSRLLTLAPNQIQNPLQASWDYVQSL